MKISVASAVLVGSGLISVVSAHSRVWSLWIDGVDQGMQSVLSVPWSVRLNRFLCKGAGAGVYIRQPPTNNPIKDLTS